MNVALEQAILNDELERQAKWTQAIAVGERAFVEAIEAQINRAGRWRSAKKAMAGCCVRSKQRFMGAKSEP